jgi:iron(III) transport system substrate-binding protein
MKQLLGMVALAATLATVAAACGGGRNDAAGRAPAVRADRATADREPADTLTVYSRDREIAEPLLERFEKKTGIEIRALWGDPIVLADQIIEDGSESPADVYYGPLSDALGALSAAGRLATLSDAQLDRVPGAYRSPEGTWAAISGRAHVVFYNSDKLSEDDLPDSILGFTDPTWRGRIAWDPASRSLQAAVAALRQVKGKGAARRWLEGIQANAPAAIQGAFPIVDVVAAGEIAEVGFGSHFYLYDRQADGDAKNVAAKFYGGDPGAQLNVDGVGIIKGTENEPAASAFVDFMLSQTTKRYLARDNVEIPVVESIQPPEGLPTAGELTVPDLDVRQLEELDGARQLLTRIGIIG